MNIPIKMALESFVLDCDSRKLSGRTIRFYKDTLNPFFETVKLEYVHEITSNHIRKFIVEIGEQWKPTTQHAYARSIRVFLNFCVREEFIQTSPMANVRMPKLPKTILPSFTPADIEKMLGNCKIDRDRAMIYFMLDTGCRVSEIATMKYGDIDMTSGEVKIKEGKGSKDRYTFFGSKTKKQLMRYFIELGKTPEKSDALWISNRTGEGLTIDGLKTMFKEWKKETGIPHLSAHTFRRTFCIQSLRNGMNIFVLQRLTGHSDISTLRTYLSILHQDLADSHQKYGVVDSM